ncbi:hypothetical protein [Agromyces marinus]|uniref:Uncharacterized protein n=1 Tax=Agromyces marinus TaxID=1389020 RepID=A0ABN6YEX8_9MICO|nr:hypothetical protein [Agromyces marinus]UIP57413.1 hypothetical protein DSM26151_02680 [Agromyces marinus]BDZ54467.1 hypothetical protein GCM10025870_15400 [Agromyces marinus]
MPIVTVIHPEHSAGTDLLTRVADAVSDSLGLGPGDVIAMGTPVLAAVASGGAATHPWPVVTIHGSDRGREAHGRACDAASGAVADWAEEHGIRIEGTWSEWITPQPSA